ncbi:hypothetical protein L1887_23538 [Cichorium endivia]|nr:hypothetical protein L1887_23538 [Cichorium endivia]
MENMKQQSGGSPSSSFTETLFGPKDGGSSSSGLFGSVFGPSSTGLRTDSSHCNYTGSSNKQDFGSPKHSTPDYKSQRSKGEKGRNPVYNTETAEPSYLSSSIYYGGQEVYPPTTNNNGHQRNFKKGGGDEDPSASRGNWWQGSLYY